MKNKRNAVVLVLVILILAAVTCWLVFKPETSEGVKNITVEVTHKDGTVNAYDITTDAVYLYDALREAEIVGALIDGYFTELDGEEAKTSDEEWWGYTKSGEYVSYGVADCAIEDGDHYEFTFNVGW